MNPLKKGGVKMKKVSKGLSFFLICMVLTLVSATSVFAAVGWVNEGWSGPNWLYKACNSKTTVFDTPQYSYMSATAKIGSQTVKEERNNPSPNTYVHAIANSGYNETCYTWGDVRQP